MWIQAGVSGVHVPIIAVTITPPVLVRVLSGQTRPKPQLNLGLCEYLL
jgi:hypothetical protein